ncbi:hypothetical protein GCM10009551_062280 [Nocardiopsis tropica]
MSAAWEGSEDSAQVGRAAEAEGTVLTAVLRPRATRSTPAVRVAVRMTRKLADAGNRRVATG